MAAADSRTDAPAAGQGGVRKSRHREGSRPSRCAGIHGGGKSLPKKRKAPTPCRGLCLEGHQDERVFSIAEFASSAQTQRPGGGEAGLLEKPFDVSTHKQSVDMIFSH